MVALGSVSDCWGYDIVLYTAITLLCSAALGVAVQTVLNCVLYSVLHCTLTVVYSAVKYSAAVQYSAVQCSPVP